MLTIDEIKNISFRKAGMHGYNADDVDEFIDDVVELIESSNAEKADLKKKLDILAKRIEKYREDEETVRNALLSSQKVADQSIREANDKATYIIKAAEKKSRSILTEAEMATERAKDRYEGIQADTAQLKKEIIALYKKHLSIVEEMPNEDDVKKSREELDEKYPLEHADEVISSAQDDIEEMEEAEAKEAPVEEKTERKAVVVEPKSEKFESLKFGDNYDVE
ncbi:MAG: DivIVA domain-containing protein [Oscillospiraceae bacterium]|nr:DivIVA domain-containing protein [Candidatus Ruminococcus equi]